MTVRTTKLSSGRRTELRIPRNRHGSGRIEQLAPFEQVDPEAVAKDHRPEGSRVTTAASPLRFQHRVSPSEFSVNLVSVCAVEGVNQRWFECSFKDPGRSTNVPVPDAEAYAPVPETIWNRTGSPERTMRWTVPLPLLRSIEPKLPPRWA